MFGILKKYYASIKLNRLQYKFSRLVDKTVMVHCFELDDEKDEKSEFYIIAIKMMPNY